MKSKPSLNNLNEVLTYILEGMYDAEKQIQEVIPEWSQHTNTTSIKNQVKRYAENTRDKRTKLKRVFSYLLTGPFKRKNGVVKKMLKEWSVVSGMTESKPLADVLFISFLMGLIEFKKTKYFSARNIALQLNLQTVADLLDEIVVWEKETANALTKIALAETNQKASAVGILK